MKTDENKEIDQIFQAEVGPSLAGKRLDHALVSLFGHFSRSQLQTWTKEGFVLVNQKTRSPSDKVALGDKITLKALMKDKSIVEGQPVDLNIIFEDTEVIILNKKAGLVVHPGAGNYDQTIQNGLIYHDKELMKLPRAGIVHRLDKNTTGLMVVAKTNKAYLHLTQELAKRKVKRIYKAITVGRPRDNGTINLPIARHQTNRIKMAVSSKGKEAISHYKKLKEFACHALLQIDIDTGRTHQIRVHLSHLGFPIIGDPIYNKIKINTTKMPKKFLAILSDFNRQALHATSLAFHHPSTSKLMKWNTPLPEDMSKLLLALDVNDNYSEDEFDERFQIELEKNFN